MISVLRRIVQRVAQAGSVTEAMNEVVGMTRIAMSCDCCSLYIADEDDLWLGASEGLSHDAVGDLRLKKREGVVGWVADREEPLNLADARSHPSFKFIPQAEEDDLRAFLAAPVIHRRRLLGVLVVQQRDAREFSDEEESFLVTLASQLASELSEQPLNESVQPNPKHYSAVVASPGIAIAPGMLARPKLALIQPEIVSDDPGFQWQRLEHALVATSEELAELGGRLSAEVESELTLLFDCYQELLSDSELQQMLKQHIDDGWVAETAVSKVVLGYVAQFESMTDDYFKDRAADIRDLGQRLLDQLARPGSASTVLKEPVILVAKEITATMLAEIPRDKLAGIVSQKGGINSHGAIFARAMGVPALVGLEGIKITELGDRPLLLDGQRGRLWIEPEPTVVSEYRILANDLAARSARFRESLGQDCVSRDGVKISLMLNVGLKAEDGVLSLPAVQGVGLYRTEALFMSFSQFPTELQQEKAYRALLEAAEGKPVTVRTLDVGGDKPLPYLPVHEANPFLGWRGVRMSLDHPDLFLIQVRALIKAADGQDNLKILIPMISRLDEIRGCRELIERAVAELTEELGHAVIAPKFGIMVEVPAALFQLAHWWQWVDFMSVGSNDLAQYLLAVDRNNTQVGQQFDNYHPAVVAALATVAAQSEGKDFGLCGELAGEVTGALMLLALGYRHLSMNAQALGPISHLINNIDINDLDSLRQCLLSQTESRGVRHCLDSFLKQQQLGELIPTMVS